jgi:hypothetical protein
MASTHPDDRFELAGTSGGEPYLAAGFGGAYAIALLDPTFESVRVRGVRIGVGRLPSETTILRADSQGASLLVERGLQYEVIDHPRNDFIAGVMGSCL